MVGSVAHVEGLSCIKNCFPSLSFFFLVLVIITFPPYITFYVFITFTVIYINIAIR
jgi:hypothetical protein